MSVGQDVRSIAHLSFLDFMELDYPISLPDLYIDLYNPGGGGGGGGKGGAFLHCCVRMLGAVCSDMGGKVVTSCGVPVT